MTRTARFACVLAGLFALTAAAEFAGLRFGTGSIVPAAEARIGRPLTPVSVAGVGRRTVRRCAVGVYDC